MSNMSNPATIGRRRPTLQIIDSDMPTTTEALRNPIKKSAILREPETAVSPLNRDAVSQEMNKKAKISLPFIESFLIAFLAPKKR